MGNRKVGVNIQLDRDFHDRLRQAAYEQRRRQSEIVREALREYLSRRGYRMDEKR